VLRTEIAILVVDDNAEDGRLLEQNLAQTGHSRRLHFCRSTQEAEDILQDTHYDVVLTDHQPPQIDAFQLLRHLQHHKNGTPVLFLTSQGTEKMASEAIKQGAYDYLTKEELEGSSIAHILETVLERRKLKEQAQAAQALLRQLAVQDSLTKVYNRRYFQLRLEEEFTRSQRYHRPLSVIMIDIDYFKEINDEAGHLSGDIALTEMANTLKKELRCVDILARYGGDEFGMILPETASSPAIKLAQRLRLSIAELPLELDERHWPITASLGVASLGPTIQTPEDLLTRADQALYAAKHNGRDRVCSEIDLLPGKVRAKGRLS